MRSSRMAPTQALGPNPGSGFSLGTHYGTSRGADSRLRGTRLAGSRRGGTQPGAGGGSQGGSTGLACAGRGTEDNTVGLSSTYCMYRQSGFRLSPLPASGLEQDTAGAVLFRGRDQQLPAVPPSVWFSSRSTGRALSNIRPSLRLPPSVLYILWVAGRLSYAGRRSRAYNLKSPATNCTSCGMAFPRGGDGNLARPWVISASCRWLRAAWPTAL